MRPTTETPEGVAGVIAQVSDGIRDVHVRRLSLLGAI